MAGRKKNEDIKDWLRRKTTANTSYIAPTAAEAARRIQANKAALAKPAPASRKPGPAKTNTSVPARNTGGASGAKPKPKGNHPSSRAR